MAFDERAYERAEWQHFPAGVARFIEGVADEPRREAQRFVLGVDFGVGERATGVTVVILRLAREFPVYSHLEA